MEHIISFYGIPPEDSPFQVDMAGITYPDPSYHIERRHSDIWCLEYIVSGTGTVTVDNHTIYPAAGDVYILPYNRNHRYFSSKEEPFHKIWMNLRGSLCHSLFQAYGLEGILLVKEAEVFPLFQKFLTICETRELSYTELNSKCALVFHEILIALSQCLAAQNRPISTAGEILDYMHRHSYDRLTMEQLSEQFHLSVSQIHRQFRKEYGVSPYHYLLEIKIGNAKLLLRNTAMTVKEISALLNFTDEHYFSNLFYKKTGFRPAQYRSSFLNFNGSEAIMKL